MKFRKRPIVIEAFQWLGVVPIPNAPQWFNEKNKEGEVLLDIQWNDEEGHLDDAVLEINTLEGVMKASMGDWIIQGVNGEIYPCKPDIFEKTYEKVE